MTDTLTALRADYEALGKRIAELEKQKPCPLEEGKLVDIHISPDKIKEWFAAMTYNHLFARVSVETDKQSPDGVGGIAIRIGFSDYNAKKKARQLVEICGGGSSD